VSEPTAHDTSPNITRRALLKVGVAGGVALFLARWLYTRSSAPPFPDAPFAALDARARTIVSAIVPVLLEGALPATKGDGAARANVVANVDLAIAGLPPEARQRLDQLFALLAFAPSRCLIAGVWSPWPEASPASIAAFLTRWRDSRFALLQSAYAAFHQLVVAAWYGSPNAWPAIGYPGPPSLEVG
jgi:hypothetical protein